MGGNALNTMYSGVVLIAPDSGNFCIRQAHFQKQNKANNGEVMH